MPARQRTDWIDITPAVAEDWLSQQFEGQRNLREHHVLMLAEEMEAGSFIPHSAIVFALHNGKKHLIDGQHRLKAVTVYGDAVTMPVLTLEAGTIEQVRTWYGNIDQGLRRSAIDAIRAQGLAQEINLSERQAARLTGAVRLIATGFLDVTNRKAAVKAVQARSRSNAVVSDLVRKWSVEAQQFYESIQGGEQTNKFLFDRAPVIACAMLTLRHRPTEALEFWRTMAQDDGLARHDPRKRFLLWLRDNKEKPPATAKAFSVAWKAYLDGRELSLIRFDAAKPIRIMYVPLDDEIITTSHGAADLKGELQLAGAA